MLRGGGWQKTSFVRENPQRSRLNECHDLKANPWIQYYRSSCKQGSLEVPVVDTGASKVSSWLLRNTFSLYIYIYIKLIKLAIWFLVLTEMSDQNFADEEVEGERENNRRDVKRLKKSLMTAAMQ